MSDFNALGSSLPSLSLLTAVALGGLHALEPGHGKLIIVTYMGQPTAHYVDILKLGGIITFAHSLVLVAGVLLFFLIFHSFDVLHVQGLAILQLISATLVVLLGFNMIRRFPPPWKWYSSLSATSPLPNEDTPCTTSCQHKANTSSDSLVLNAPNAWQRHKELFLLGFMSGLRPCPLTLSSLSLAMSMGELKALAFVGCFTAGMAGMLMLFGLVGKLGGTGLELGGRRFEGLQKIQRLFLEASGLLVFIMGLWFVWRSLRQLLSLTP
jgi:nickel/cobalt exporter